MNWSEFHRVVEVIKADDDKVEEVVRLLLWTNERLGLLKKDYGDFADEALNKIIKGTYNK